MLMSMVSHLLCAWFAFLLPSYSTYKALSSPLSGELQGLSMYWAVVGAFIAIESTIGPFVSWLPFYWESRTLFLLYLSLPQIQGSTYIYKTYLEPFCSKNEAELDSGIASAQNNVLSFLQSRISMLIDLLWTILNKTPIIKQPQATREGQAGQQLYSLESVKGLWTSYGPAIMGGLSKSSTKHSSSPDPVAKQATYASGADVNHDGGQAPEARSEST
ncbi:TB2/DP1, HVA22 family-domain-containing protein [Suillus placidus]|uniref:Protein YOP1 n=1 Tax=Suillus placidus TaxID=48579 RepID=A0A9P7A7W4_9AGAM|nr:TB2/DP1, HVA22 family-domain-containing protein [Suillus placidus]